ncbi:MAG: polyprenol monophosphomannose synthase [Bdellovibrionales bacterium]|nr:polyprenol monophosphomannose synthase [Bdellovibrionales bacterium]
MNKNKVAITIPTFNERDNILNIIKAIHAEIPTADILIVDDNSPDGTAKLVEEFIEQNIYVSLLKRKKKDGLGKAYFAGFKHLISEGYSQIVQMDADFSHQPKYLKDLIAKVKNGADVAIGSRYVLGGGVENWSLYRRIISRGGSLYSRYILGLSVNDVTGGFKCWNASFLDKVISANLKLSGFGFQIEMSYRCKLLMGKIVESPIIFPDRIAGDSKMSGRIFKEALLGVWKLRILGKKVLTNQEVDHHHQSQHNKLISNTTNRN